MSDEPTTLSEIDRNLAEYRQILTKVSVGGRVAVWEQIDRLLDMRAETAKRERREARTAARARRPPVNSV